MAMTCVMARGAALMLVVFAVSGDADRKYWIANFNIDLQLAAQQQALAKGSPFTLSCEMRAQWVNKVSTGMVDIQLNKIDSKGNHKTMASTSLHKLAPMQVSRRQLSVSILQATCDQHGEYSCRASLNSSDTAGQADIRSINYELFINGCQ